MQSAISLKNYFDREAIAQRAHRCEAWYFFYADRILMLVADKHDKSALGMTVAEVSNVFDKSLSDLKAVLEQFELAGKEYQQTHIVLGTREYTFVPEPLFDSADALHHLKLVHHIPALYEAYYERSGNLVNVYGVKYIFYNTVRRLLEGAVIHHYAGALAGAIGGTQGGDKQNRLYVNLHSGHMDMLFYEGRQLKYHNFFQVEADTDVIYFILSAAELLKLNNEKWEVVLSGNVASGDSLISLMKKYIPEVLFMEKAKGMNVPAAFNEFAAHRYFLEIMTCCADH